MSTPFVYTRAGSPYWQANVNGKRVSLKLPHSGREAVNQAAAERAAAELVQDHRGTSRTVSCNTALDAHVADLEAEHKAFAKDAAMHRDTFLCRRVTILLTFPGPLTQEGIAAVRGAGFRFSHMRERWEGLVRPDDVQPLVKSLGGTMKRRSTWEFDGSMPISALRTSHMRALVRARRAEGVSNQTIKHEQGLVRAAVRKAMDDGAEGPAAHEDALV